MSVTTAAGTILYISASIPATFDQAGYEASAVASSLTPIGEIVSIGSHGRVYAEVKHMPLATRGARKFKGSFDDGTLDLNLARDTDDAGQIIAKQALASDNDYSFKIAYPSGDVEYFQAKVLSLPSAADGSDSIVSRTMQVSISASNTGVGIVEVLAV